jgi:hypothetical protein
MYLHRIDYDDGDIDFGLRLWKETVHLRSGMTAS